MAQKGPTRRRLFVEDARGNGLYLRTTWHPEAGQFVISTWDDEVCTGAVRVPAATAAPLIGLLADGLADATAAQPRAEPPSRRGGALDRLRTWFRRRGRVAARPAPALRAMESRKSA